MIRVVSYEKHKKAEIERTLFRTYVMSDAVRFYFSLQERNDIVILDKLNQIVEVQLEAA